MPGLYFHHSFLQIIHCFGEYHTLDWIQVKLFLYFSLGSYETWSPKIFVHNTKNELDPYELSLQLMEKLQKNIAPVELITIEDACHTPAKAMDDFIPKIAEFLYGLILNSSRELIFSILMILQSVPFYLKLN